MITCTDYLIKPKLEGNYLWSTGELTNSINVSKNGNYWVQITDTNNCIVSDSFVVVSDCFFSFHLPNSFTPNMDGLNDVYMGKGTGISEFKMTIFNRWGKLIFESNNLDYGWNGTIMSGGEIVPQGAYVCVVVLKDLLGRQHQFIEQVYLIR